MSVLTRNRFVFLLIAALLLAGSAFANPSSRAQARMVYDPTTNTMVLFGGITPTDFGTRLAYDLDETWLFTGSRWIRRFVDPSPPGRSGHVMVWDSIRNRAILFGGKNEQLSLEYNDTWAWKNDAWTRIDTPNQPPTRFLSGAAFDPIRDRVVLFGGQYRKADKSLDHYYDTWEFDGTTWRAITTNAPAVRRPALVWDGDHNQVLMIGVNDKDTPEQVMYAYDPAAAKWNSIAMPTTHPTCINESGLVWEEHKHKILLVGGACSSPSSEEETWEWDGQAWTKLVPKAGISRAYGAAVAYDPYRDTVFMYGGNEVFGGPRASLYRLDGTDWVAVAEDVKPSPRSLASFRTDPENQAIWLYGGLTDDGLVMDLWRYQNSQWARIPATDKAPTTCGGQAATYDTDRKRMVIVCGNMDVFEWDGTVWTAVAKPAKQPSSRRQASFVYDPVQKKSVLLGGYDDLNGYFSDTWLWDGTNWTEVKKDRYTSRAVAMAWFDTKLQKVVVYGGIGRKNTDGRIERYSDMWSFDPAQGWKKLEVTTTPGQRMGAQYTVDPNTGKVLLFGGLLEDLPTPETRKEIFANDLWSWDGSTWTKLTAENAPPGRQNGAFAYDPISQKFVLFGGYSGYYLNDVWTFDGTRWSVYEESIVRRRAVGRR